MSQESEGIARNAFHTFHAEGIDAALSFCSPDVVWYPTDRWLDDSARPASSG
jgi:hypothetical protein